MVGRKDLRRSQMVVFLKRISPAQYRLQVGEGAREMEIANNERTKAVSRFSVSKGRCLFDAIRFVGFQFSLKRLMEAEARASSKGVEWMNC